jgi:hypothetical protein
MKKILSLIILLFIGGALFTGCSSNVVVEGNINIDDAQYQVEAETNSEKVEVSVGKNSNPVEHYLLLKDKLPSGYWLTTLPYSGSMNSNLIKNPGKIKSNFVEIIESDFGLKLTNYVVAIYTHGETLNEVTVMIINPSNSKSFNIPGSSSMSTILETEEGYIIVIEELLQGREDFTKKFQSLFSGISKKSYSPKSDTFFHKRVNFSTNLFSGYLINSYVSLKDNSVYISFNYIGSKKIFINSKNLKLTTNDGKSCNIQWVRNKDSMNNFDSNENNPLFLSGDSGTISFKCPDLNMKYGDILKGNISIGITNSSKQNLIEHNGSFKLFVK